MMPKIEREDVKVDDRKVFVLVTSHFSEFKFSSSHLTRLYFVAQKNIRELSLVFFLAFFVLFGLKLGKEIRSPSWFIFLMGI